MDQLSKMMEYYLSKARVVGLFTLFVLALAASVFNIIYLQEVTVFGGALVVVWLLLIGTYFPVLITAVKKKPIVTLSSGSVYVRKFGVAFKWSDIRSIRRSDTFWRPNEIEIDVKEPAKYISQVKKRRVVRRFNRSKTKTFIFSTGLLQDGDQLMAELEKYYGQYKSGVLQA